MAQKTFPYSVIYNGVLYAANAPIEVKEQKATAPKAGATKKPTKKAGVKNDEGTSREP